MHNESCQSWPTLLTVRTHNVLFYDKEQKTTGMRRVDPNHTYIRIYSVCTVFLAGKVPYIWCAYTVLANPKKACTQEVALDRGVSHVAEHTAMKLSTQP